MKKLLLIGTVLLFLLSFNVFATLDENLIACLTLDDADVDGVRAINSAGTNDAYETSDAAVTTGVTGIIGEAYDFSGTGSGLGFEDITDFDFSATDFTVAMYARPDSLAVKNRCFFGSAGTGNQYGVFANIDLTNGDLYLLLDNDGTPWDHTDDVSDPYAFAVGQNSFMAVRHNGTALSGFMNISDTVTEVNTITTTDRPYYNTGQNFSIGAYITGGAVTNDEFDGMLDEVMIWNRALTLAELEDLYSNKYSCADVLASGVSFTIGTLFPANNTQYNTNSLNFNTTVNATNPFNCTLFINNTLNQTSLNIENGTDVLVDFDVTFSNNFDSELTTYINCLNADGDANTTTNTFFIDNVNPTITWTNPLEDNSSYYSDSTTLNIVISDNNLYSYELNLTNSSGGVVYNDLNTSLTGLTSKTINDLLNFTGNSSGYYQFDLRVCDGHTKNNINDFDVVSDTYYLQFNEITIISFDAINTFYEKKSDRYSFGFQTAVPLTELEFTLPTSCKYLPNTEYLGHYVCNDKYWLDFEGDYEEVEVLDNKIKIKSSDPRTVWTFNSIGELNCIQESVNVTIDATAPTLSNFQFIALDSNRDQIGTDSGAFNTSNIQNIEYMNISFTLTDDFNLGNYSLYFTANGSNGCSLGNLQSAACYNYSDGNYVQFISGQNTSTFNDTGTSGDFITCDYNGSTTVRDYRCTIDEHYNPNVFKHYPYNFGDVLWQTGTTVRIKVNNIWKIDVSGRDIPNDALTYKLDFRVNYTAGNAPDETIDAYYCNSTYTSGRPALSDNCALIAQKLPAQLQDDGTKFRGLFTTGLINQYGPLKYIIITSEENTPNSYYYMKSIKYAGSESVITETSSNAGNTYSSLGGGYETELNINWFADGADPTGVIFLTQFDDGINEVNSSLNEMTWIYVDLPLPPLIAINSPLDDATITSNLTAINWTSTDPNGDTFETNVSIVNSTNTTIIGLNLPSTNTSFVYDFSKWSDGVYNLTIAATDNTSQTTTQYHTFTLDLVAAAAALPSNATFALTRFECDLDSTGKSIGLLGFAFLMVILMIFAFWIRIPIFNLILGLVMAYFAWYIANCFLFANVLFIVLGIMLIGLGIYDGINGRSVVGE